jgi:hypothetical protein
MFLAICCAANVVRGLRHVRIAAAKLATSRDLWSMGGVPAPAEWTLSPQKDWL